MGYGLRHSLPPLAFGLSSQFMPLGDAGVIYKQMNTLDGNPIGMSQSITWPHALDIGVGVPVNQDDVALSASIFNSKCPEPHPESQVRGSTS